MHPVCGECARLRAHSQEESSVCSTQRRPVQRGAHRGQRVQRKKQRCFRAASAADTATLHNTFHPFRGCGGGRRGGGRREA